MVMVSSKEEDPFFWVLDKADGDYFILEGEESREDSVLNTVDGKKIEEERQAALGNLDLGVNFDEFITPVFQEINTDTFGISSEGLNLNSEEDTVSAEFFTAP
jgi:hypothetical protein